MSADSRVDTRRLSALFDVEHRARAADSLTALRFIAVNETRGVVPYHQGALLEPGLGGWQVVALSDVPAVDRNSLYAQWLERVVARQDLSTAEAVAISRDGLGEWEQRVWDEVSPATAIMVPLAAPGKPASAWLWLGRQDVWNEGETFLLTHAAEVYGHAMSALAPRRGIGWMARLRRRRVGLAALVALSLILAIPVHLSALAPAEIVASNPTIVAAPMDGVVEQVMVEPNATVATDTPLLRLQDLEVRTRFDVASEALKVAQARYSKALQESFDNADSRAELATLKAEVDLRAVEKTFAQQQLDRIVLTAAHPGLVIFNDPNDWAGRPVQTGERIMELANPASREVRIELPVDDAIVLEGGAPIRLFLDSRPLSPVDGRIERVSYKPEVNARDQLVYKVTATLTEDRDYLRIGLRGTAKVSGDRVPLAYYLLRRPITALRQTFGL